MRLKVSFIGILLPFGFRYPEISQSIFQIVQVYKSAGAIKNKNKKH